MKILHINSADKTGGAAIAAFRHSQALNSAGFESAMLVVNKSSNDPMVLRPEHSGKFTSVKSHISAFLYSKYMSRYSPYATWSYPLTGFDLSKEKCVREADVIFLHSIEQALQWSQNLSENQIKERSDAVVQYSTLFSIERFGQEFNRFLDDICRTAASN